MEKARQLFEQGDKHPSFCADWLILQD